MKTTLLIDGNWLLMSRLFATKEYFKIDNDDNEKQRGVYELNDLMSRSINIIISRFENVIDNIILCSDGGSWRKKLDKPSFFDDVYKGNREKAVEYDWKYIYKSLDDMCTAAANNDITVSHVFGAEGDDCIWYWSKKLNKKGINTIIWSADCDLKQLIQVDNFAFTAWYNDKNGLWLHKCLEEQPIDDIDFFLQQDKSNMSLDMLKSICKQVEYIDPASIVTSKIICGDGSDNIKSLIRIEKGSKTYKISEKTWLNTKNKLNIDTLQKFWDRKDDIINFIISSKKYSGYNINTEHVSELFEYNKKLVWLDESVVPEDIKSKLDDIEYKECNLPYIRGNYKTLVLNNIEDIKQEDVESIFESSIPDLPF